MNKTATGKFQRGLTEKALCKLREISSSDAPHWFKDMLSLWQPSGVAAGVVGLRLAVRHNYLNFYYKGQSLARVVFDKDGNPRAEVHHKYIQGGAQGQEYAKLRFDSITLPGGESQPYRGLASLKEWIGKIIDGDHVGVEKGFVDDLISNNSSVIDLEMGLPAYDEYKTAKRMDCVALEQDAGSLRVVFWEVKTINDARLRLPRDKPEVCNQLDYYRNYLCQVDKATAVADAYAHTCWLLREIAKMAAKESMLGSMILLAADYVGRDSSMFLKVDSQPRLLIVEGDKAKKPKTWTNNLNVLKSNNLHYVVVHHSDDYRLGRL